MKKKKIIKAILIILGLIPFIIPIIWSLFSTVIDNSVGLSFTEFILYYSFLYWPTYILGIVAIAIALFIKPKKS